MDDRIQLEFYSIDSIGDLIGPFWGKANLSIGRQSALEIDNLLVLVNRVCQACTSFTLFIYLGIFCALKNTSQRRVLLAI